MGDDGFGGVVGGVVYYQGVGCWEYGMQGMVQNQRVVHTRLAKRGDGVMDWITRHCGWR